MENEIMPEKFIAAYEKIKAAKNILLATHERPDGDGLSSLCALSLFLDRLEKKYACFCADPAPDYFYFLPNIKKISAEKNFSFPDFDLIIILDCGCLERTRLTDEIVQRAKNQIVIEIDHHPKVYDYADLEIRLPKKSSAAEIIYQFFAANNLKITPPIANCILTGIVTDTGNLLFSSVSEETVKVSSAMLLAGASMPKIIRKTAGNKNLSSMKVWGRVLENLQLNEKYNFAYSVMTYEEIASFKKEFGSNQAFDAASDILNNVEGVKAVLFLREEEPGKIRGSLRSKAPEIDVSKLAAVLGGGGHPKAAAFRLSGHIEKTENSWRIV